MEPSVLDGSVTAISLRKCFRNAARLPLALLKGKLGDVNHQRALIIT